MLQNVSAWNLYPVANSALVTLTQTLLDAGTPAGGYTMEDFNGSPRSATAPTVGAYEFSAPTNPGWQLADGMCHCVRT